MRIAMIVAAACMACGVPTMFPDVHAQDAGADAATPDEGIDASIDACFPCSDFRCRGCSANCCIQIDCVPCTDPRCRGCSRGCCIVFEDAAPPADVPRADVVDIITDSVVSIDVPARDVICRSGDIVCDGGCIPGLDPLNCGSCGNRCGRSSPAPHVHDACGYGDPPGPVGCIWTCDAGYLNCNRILDDGCEVDPTNDAQNCGGCGVRCGSGICIASICR